MRDQSPLYLQAPHITSHVHARAGKCNGRTSSLTGSVCAKLTRHRRSRGRTARRRTVGARSWRATSGLRLDRRRPPPSSRCTAGGGGAPPAGARACAAARARAGPGPERRRCWRRRATAACRSAARCAVNGWLYLSFSATRVLAASSGGARNQPKGGPAGQMLLPYCA